LAKFTNLTHLNVGETNEENDIVLPTSLETLTLKSENFNALNWESLVNLTALDLQSGSEKFTEADLHRLPISLRNLDLGGTNLETIPAWLTNLRVLSMPSNTTMHGFPHGLTHLEIYATDEPLLPNILPTGLQELLLYDLESVIPVGFLPPSLTKLFLGGYQHIIKENVLPSGLTSLHFCGSFASPKVIQDCVSMKKLSISSHTQIVVPPKLAHLKLQACSSSADIYSTSLTKLEWKCMFSRPIRCSLPQNLTTFYCRNGFDDIAKLLPPTVTNLTIAYESFTCPLPQNLVKLQFVYPKNLAFLRPKAFINCRQLTHLTCCFSIRHSFAHILLPDSITHLDLGGATSLPVLPPNLRCLSLSHTLFATIEHTKFQRASRGSKFDPVTLYFY
jgi:Leucine-rich repeat (LRR) protein